MQKTNQKTNQKTGVRRRYRLVHAFREGLGAPVYKVQLRQWWGWATIKVFYDWADPDFARREAEELLDHLLEP